MSYVFPYSMSLSSDSLYCAPGNIVALTASVISNRESDADRAEKVFVTFSIKNVNNPSRVPLLSQDQKQWSAKGISLQVPYISSKVTVFIRAESASAGAFSIEAKILRKSNPAQCSLLIQAQVDDTAHKVASLGYVSGKNQFAWPQRPWSVFSEPLVVLALDAEGQPVKGAPVNFTVNTAAARMSQSLQYTDQKGQSLSAYMLALAGTNGAFTVMAECNGHRVTFSGFYVFSGSLKMSMVPVEINAGEEVTQYNHIGARGVQAAMPVLVSLSEPSSKVFLFPDYDPAWQAALCSDSKGDACLDVSCKNSAHAGTSLPVTLQSGPNLTTIMLTVKDG